MASASNRLSEFVLRTAPHNARSLHRSEAVCRCYKSRRGSEYYEKCGEMLGRLRAQADDVKAEADDNNWSDLYRSFGACEYVKFCPG